VVKLTKKEKGFVKDYVKTGHGTQSALNNYDTDDENVAGVIASENLRKPKIQEAIKSIAERIPDELLEKVHLEGLNASERIIRDGEVLAEKPDYAVRHKYLDSAYKLKGSYAPEKSQALNLNIKADVKDFNELDVIREKYEEELKQTLTGEAI
jgi:phage terminase small subunit